MRRYSRADLAERISTLLTAETMRVEFMLGGYLCAWGVFLLLPNVLWLVLNSIIGDVMSYGMLNVVHQLWLVLEGTMDLPPYRRMLRIAPYEWVWAATFMVVGGYRMVSSFLASALQRKWASLVIASFWGFLAAIVFDAQPEGFFAVSLVGFGLNSVWNFFALSWRIRRYGAV